MEAVVFQPQTRTQINLLQQLAAAMGIPVSLFSTEDSAKSAAFLMELQAAGMQAKQIAEGRKKGKTLDSLIDELD